MRALPGWARHYQRQWLAGDASASLIVALLLIPQGLAYAQLAGLPPLAGLYASLGPLLLYGIFGTSMTQSVGPMAITSAMTAAALSPLAPAGSAHYVALAATLTWLSALFLLGLGAARLGQLTRLLALPVVQAFSAATALLIALGQLGVLLGSPWRGDTLPQLLQQLPHSSQGLRALDVGYGLASFALLAAAQFGLPPLLRRWGLASIHADLAGKLAPIALLLLLAALALPWALPRLQLSASQSSAWVSPALDWASIQSLLLPALLISLAGFLQSITIAQTLAAERGQTISANRELLALGSCNLAAASLGGLPVSGGFSRTMVNTQAGAHTPLAGIFTAGLLGLALWALLPYFAFLPLALLGASIILATSRMLSWHTGWQAWRYDRRDGMAWLLTYLGVLWVGPMQGIALGVLVTMLLYLWRSQRPHVAIVGRLPGSEHFRNVDRFAVETHPEQLLVRIDENLYFANVATVLEQLENALQRQSSCRQLLLIFSAVNSVDYTAVQALQNWLPSLRQRGIELYLAELKGPVRDTLAHADLLTQLAAPPFISTHAAVCALHSPAQEEDFAI